MGVKEGIDFDHFEEVLIQPALDAAGVKGATTTELAYQGNILVAIFERLLKADSMVADMSINNANVFHELGVRHALRDRYTYLIRCNKAQVPFDRARQSYDISQRNNLWMLHNALVRGGSRVTLVALWDGKKGDGLGGTEHMVGQAQARGAKFIHLAVCVPANLRHFHCVEGVIETSPGAMLPPIGAPDEMGRRGNDSARGAGRRASETQRSPGPSRRSRRPA